MRERVHVKKDDLVRVISGKEKGKTGKITRVIPSAQQVIVEKLNMVKRHTKPTQTNPKGGIVEQERPIHASNVALVEAGKKISKAKKES
ncbi:MAG: 50S ribosomal protein L24 [Deltaproteobacteria bacterium]|nr:50S ribosomal protein L24 [Deltaproteobacteria bacterium]